MRLLRSQSAMEYLMTYGWAILIIAIALSALYALGIFNPSSFVGSECILPAGLSCTSVSLAPNGMLTINLEQATLSTINITAYGCNTNTTLAHMQTPLNPPSNQINMLIGSNYTFSVQCWSGASMYSGSAGNAFEGYLLLNYTNTYSGFAQQAVGQLTAKVS